ncbi:MAG: methylenetetrahydrofolate reductase, partial [Clostridia bacterium]|nr:methylenetetrahydrofolate reductase [Clostridia bacterium]
MKISKIISSGVPSLSFEIYPPKVDTALEDVKEAARKIAALSPSFMSVTYGAGGTTAGLTLEVADAVENGFGVTALAHMTCLSSDKSVINEHLRSLREKGIENVLALRGDVPAGAEPHRGDYAHASDLARDIVSFGGFCVGGACYPEGHPESPSQK